LVTGLIDEWRRWKIWFDATQVSKKEKCGIFFPKDAEFMIKVIPSFNPIKLISR
jgi:hypothetical protein